MPYSPKKEMQVWQLQLVRLGRALPKHRSDARRLWRRTMQALLDSGKTVGEIAAQTGTSPDTLRYALRKYKVTRSASGEMIYCPCGCGRAWDKGLSLARTYHSSTCKRRHMRQLLAAGKLEVVKVNICAVCKSDIPVVRELPESDKETCSPQCANALRKTRSVEAQKKEMWWADKWKHGTASNEERREYCHQCNTMGDRVPCRHYQETCGGGCCRRDDDRRPICYEPAGTPGLRRDHPAISSARFVGL